MNSEYDAMPGITASAIKKGRISMAHMRYEMLKPRDDSDSTPSMRTGKLMHLSALQPELLLPFDGQRRGAAWELVKAQAELEGKTPVPRAEWDNLTEARAVLLADRSFRLAWYGVDAIERSVVWDCAPYGLARARPDARGPNVLIEYKSARSIEKRAFMNACESMGYALQLAWYWHGCGRPAHVWCVAQESSAPWCVGCFEVPIGTLQTAYEEAATIAARYRCCEAANSFPGPYDGPQTYERPEWAGGEWTVEIDEGNEK